MKLKSELTFFPFFHTVNAYSRKHTHFYCLLNHAAFSISSMNRIFKLT